MDRTIIELMDDMHLSSQSTFLDYYYAMQANNISQANSIINNNPSVINQITNSGNVNYLIEGVNSRELEPKEDIDYFLNDLYNNFLTMISDTKVMGDFSPVTQYETHNLVYYQGKGYYAFVKPPIGTLPTDIQYWMEYDIRGLKGYGGIDLNLKFNWNNTQSYVIGDVVVFQNKLWYAIANNTNYEPNLNHYPWVIISLPKMANKTPIQRGTPTGYDIGDFWFQITSGNEVITTTWEIRQSEPTPRFASAGFSIDSSIYIVGGILSNFVRTNINEMFDTITGTWSVKTSAPITRARAIGFDIGDKGYVVGGQDSTGNILKTVEEYDSTTNSWTTKSDYPIPIISTSGVSVNGIGYIAGGETTGNVIVSDSYSYNSANDTWTNIASKPTLSYGHTLATDGISIYAIGGIDNDKNTLGIVEAYDIATNTWSQKSELNVPRSFLSSFMQAGKIFAVGGLNSNWYSVDVNEKYDIESNTWVTDMPMNYSRSSLNTVVSRNHGYAIGGIDIGTSGVYGYVEQYNIFDIPSNFDMIVSTLLSSTSSNTVSIPMVQGGTYSYWIDWGDGTTSTDITTYNDSQATHTYATQGEYNIRLIGSLSELKFTGNIAECVKEVTKCDLNLENIDDMFNSCINLIGVASGIFSNSLNILSANRTFYNCTSFGVIPVGLFDNNTSITAFNNTFEGTSVVNIPTGLFDSNNLSSTFIGTFKDCIHLVSIPSNLFRNCQVALSFNSIFSGCTVLENLPSNLFIGNPTVTDYEYAFLNCSNLTEIPSDLFGGNAVSVNSFEGAFSGLKLNSLPIGLFQSAVAATNYDKVFENNVPAITSLPNNLFNGMNATYENAFDTSLIETIGDNSLNGLAITSDMFNGNSVLTTVGNNALWTNDTVSIAYAPTTLFQDCSALQSIGNINLSGVDSNFSLNNMFNGCTSLENVSGFFYGENNQPSLAQDISFASCPLTHQSLINISNSLVTNTPTTMKTLTLGTTNLNKLSDLEKLLIINKYWNLPGYDPTQALATGATTLAPELVQTLYGNSGTQADLGIITSLYYYVNVSTNIAPITNIEAYAVDQSTGIVYSTFDIPIHEYWIYAGVNSIEAEGYYISKGSEGDSDGTILKNALTNTILTSSATKYLEIGNSDLSRISPKYSGLEELKVADSVFEGFTHLTEINIRGGFSPNSMNRMFAGCDSLVNIGFNIGIPYNESLDLDTSNCAQFNEVFYHDYSLSQISGISNIDTSNMEEMIGTFNTCDSISDWSFTNLWDVSNVKDSNNMFYRCSGLKSMLNGTMTNIENASYMYSESGLLSVLGNKLGTTLQNAQAMFGGCEDLTSLPSDYTTIFGHNNNLTNVSSLFEGCTSLENVGVHNVFTLVEDPEGMEPPEWVLDNTKLSRQIFTYCPNITDMSYIVSGCTQLGANTSNKGIPIALFYYCPKVINISHAFDGCANIYNDVGVIANTVLFINNPEIKDVSYAFANSSVGFMGENSNGYLLFPVQTKLENASYLWYNCQESYASGYEDIPFVYKSKVLKNIEGMFMGQTFTRSLPYVDEYTEAAYDWSKLNEICPVLENCSKMFYGNTGLSNSNTFTATNLISTLNKITTLTNHAQAFANCTALSDYNSIPSDWK